MKSSNPLILKLREINSSGRVALCGYFLAGYDTPKSFYSYVKSLHNIDIMEFGIPSEDPFLDGPDISKAHHHVTKNLGINAEIALTLIGGLRTISQPRFVMTYTKDGRELEGFIKLCLLNSVHGILAPDISFDEAKHISIITSSLNIAYVGFIHTEMSDELVKNTVEICDIVYLKVSSGATGQKGELNDSVLFTIKKYITELRQLKPTILIAAGIGIQTPEQIQTLTLLDINMIVVGTSLLQKMDSGVESLLQYTQTLSDATIRERDSLIAFDL